MKALPASINVDSLLGSDASSAQGSSGGLESIDVFEKRLIDDACNGCEASYRILVERHQDMILRLCLRLLSCEEDAREVCQDTFLNAYRKLPDFQAKSRFSTWLYSIALNLCRDHLRARSRKKRRGNSTPALQEIGNDTACLRPGPDEYASLSDDLQKLSLGIDQLPIDLRTALILAAVEGFSHQECAEILGCSIRAVEGRVRRARQALMDWWNTQS